MAMIIVKVAEGTTDNQHFVVVLGVFAVAAFKLLPSVNKISSYYAAIIHNGVVIEKIRDEYREIAENKEKMEEAQAKKQSGKKISLEKEIRVEHMEFTYPNVEEPVLKDVNVTIPKNTSVAFIGPSGAGKTTILNILGGMDSLTSGKVYLDGQEISSYDKKQLTSYRRYDIGFVFQFYNLVQNLTAVENVELAAQICKDPLDAVTVLEEVGLKERLANFPAQLSGGEQQRVAIARALAKNPKLLLCDEPTGALDYNTGKAVLKLLQDTCRERGKTVVVITHNQAITAMADRIITVKNGTVVKMERNAHIVDIADIEW